MPVDLTADTPPEGARVERMTEEPQVPAEPAPAEAEEGPSTNTPAAASPPPEKTLAGSPPCTKPEGAEAAEGSRVRPTPRGFSLMNNGHRAERLMAQVILPEFQEELRHLGATRFFREAFSALVRVTNSLGATREVLDEWEAIIRQTHWDAEEAQARAEAAERAREVAEKALEAARNDHAAEAREAANRAEAEANQLRAALSQLCEAESAIEARDLHIAELGSAIQAAEARATRAEEAEREAISMAEEKEA